MSAFPVSRRRQRSFAAAAIVLAVTAVAAAVPLRVHASTDPAPCKPASGAWQIDATCVDPDFVDVIITSEADVLEPSPHHRISGTIAGSAFNIYLPPSTTWEGRLFQTTYPIQAADATDEQIAFALDSGAGLVQAKGAAGYRLEAAVVKYAKAAAAAHFESDAQVFAYLSGGSGGSYPTTGAMENTTGVWDGYVPFITGSPTAIPNNFFARAFARFVLEDKAEQISDAVKPGGSGDPFAGLSPLEDSVLREVTRLGLPLEGWSGLRYILGLDTADQLLGFGGNVRALDPSYVSDFWNSPGYLGVEDSELGDFFRAERITADVVIDSVVKDDAGAVTSVRVSQPPVVTKPWIPTDYTVVGADGMPVKVTGVFDPATGVFSLGQNSESVRALLVEGATLHMDNSWSLALFGYHRYQTPSASDIHAWDQYRAPDGGPRYPVRTIRLGEVIAGSISGGASYSGDVGGKVIIVDNLLDVDAYPWAGAWYADRAKDALGDRYDDNVRLWYFENSDHVGEDEFRVVPYSGVLERAFLDVAAWVEDGRAPAPSTSYTVTDDSQIGVDSDASERGGIQPSVELTVSGADRIDVEVGQPVTFELSAEVPPGQGEVIDVQWDFTGSGTYAPAASTGSGVTFTYASPGTYFAAVRVTVDREGEPGGTFGQVMNLDRVRVVVNDGSAPRVDIAAAPATPDGTDGWYSGPVTLTPSTTDDFDPAPLVEASIDGEDFSPSAKTIDISTEGEHTVALRAVDASGKWSDTVTWSGKIDFTAPEVVATLASSTRRVSLTATDALSGVGLVEYAVLKKPGAVPQSWTVYTAPITLRDPKAVIAYRATDRAGNRSAIAEFDPRGSTAITTRTTADVDPVIVRSGTTVMYKVRIDAGGPSPVGTVTIRDGGKIIATVDVGLASHGRVEVAIPSVRRGMHLFTAEFSGVGYKTSVSSPDVFFAY